MNIPKILEKNSLIALNTVDNPVTWVDPYLEQSVHPLARGEHGSHTQYLHPHQPLVIPSQQSELDKHPPHLILSQEQLSWDAT